MGASLNAQFDAFMEVAFDFEFPYQIFLSMVGMGLTTAIIATYFPTANVTRRTVANTLKRID